MNKKFGGDNVTIPSKFMMYGEDRLFDVKVDYRDDMEVVDNGEFNTKEDILNRCVEKFKFKFEKWPTYKEANQNPKMPKRTMLFRVEDYEKIKDFLWTEISKIEEDNSKKVQIYFKLRDVALIEILGYERYVNICMGQSSHGGWGHHEKGQLPKFKEREAYLKYNTKCTKEIVKEIGDILKAPSKKAEYDKIKNSLYAIFGCDKTKQGSHEYLNALLTEFVEFINKNKNKGEEMKNYRMCRDRLQDTHNEDFNFFMREVYNKIEAIESPDARKTFQTLITFSMEYCHAFETVKTVDTFEGFGTFGPIKTIKGVATVATDTPQNDIMSGGAGELVIPTRRNSRKWIYIFSVILIIYFSFVIFESYRKLALCMDRILQGYRDHALMYPNDPNQTVGDITFMTYILTFFKVMYEAISGLMIETLNKLDGQEALETMNNIFQTASQQALQDEVERCADGYVTCFNNWLTGRTRERGQEQIMAGVNEGAELLYIQKKFELKGMIRELRSDIHSSTTNIFTAINGLSFTFILLLHTQFPQRYNRTILVTSVGLLCASYTTNPLSVMRITAAQLLLLVSPRMYVYITGPSLQEIQDSEENLLNNNDPEGVATRLLIADAPEVQTALGMIQRYRSDSDSSSRGGKNKKSTKRRKQYRHKTQKR